jgi:hypothetical protein
LLFIHNRPSFQGAKPTFHAGSIHPLFLGSVRRTGPEAQIANRHGWQASAQLLQEFALLKMRQLLKQHRAVHKNLQNAPPQDAYASMAPRSTADYLGPCFFQLNPFMPPAPAPSCEQATQDFSYFLGF